jgi:cell wall-associated NlpC family hydrolase
MARQTLVILVVVSVAGAGCATTGSSAAKGGKVANVPRPFPGATTPSAKPDEPIVARPPFDCSGFVQCVFAQHGTTLPRDVKQQFDAGRKIDADEVKAGDLVFFHTGSRGASHVGISIGGDEFVHAPSSNGVVRIERLSTEYWSKRWVGARRITPETSHAD